jgi:hypothetical protein
MSASTSRTTRWLDSDVSTTSTRHSRMKSSTITRMRQRHPSARTSETKSRLQRWFGACGKDIGAHVRKASLATATTAHRRSLLAVEPEQLLVIELDPPPQQEQKNGTGPSPGFALCSFRIAHDLISLNRPLRILHFLSTEPGF